MGKVRFIVIELWYMHLNFLTDFSFPMHAIQYTNNTVIVRKKNIKKLRYLINYSLIQRII